MSHCHMVQELCLEIFSELGQEQVIGHGLPVCCHTVAPKQVMLLGDIDMHLLALTAHSQLRSPAKQPDMAGVRGSAGLSHAINLSTW